MASLEHGRWHAIPGLEGAEVFPFIRKPDIVSSNSYVIRAGSDLVIIDPGADAEQMGQILAMVEEGVASGLKAGFYLTHCHVDHCFQIVSALHSGGFGPVRLSLQEEGVNALRGLDPDVTQARIMGWVFPPSFLEVRYAPLPLGGRASLTGEVSLGTKVHSLVTDGGLILDSHHVPLGGGHMEVFHTPGHSPDSVCYQIGSLLMTGDLLFAADPGIAGAVGWDRDQLVASVRKVLWLLRTRDISTCCPGHGRLVDRTTAEAVLEGMLARAGELGSVKTNDLARVRFTSDYAMDILTEANEAFSILAGRLYYLSFYLEELEESEGAKRCMDSIQADRIDELLAGFHRFVEEFRAGRKVQLQVVLKAIQTIQSIELLFRGTELQELLDASIMRRTSRLLHDFTHAIKGVEFAVDLQPCALGGLVERALAVVDPPLPPEEELMDSLGDDQAYLDALARRIAHLPIYDDMVFEPHLDDGDTIVLADEGRLVDALCGLLEEYAGVDVRTIGLRTSARDGLPTIEVWSDHAGRLLGQERERAHRRRFELAGATFSQGREASRFVIGLSAGTP